MVTGENANVTEAKDNTSTVDMGWIESFKLRDPAEGYQQKVFFICLPDPEKVQKWQKEHPYWEDNPSMPNQKKKIEYDPEHPATDYALQHLDAWIDFIKPYFVKAGNKNVTLDVYKRALKTSGIVFWNHTWAIVGRFNSGMFQESN